jgi:small subunit ribosomal protein S16
MKQMGRTHRHYYRIVAIDHRQPRDGKVIEDLGSYDPHVKDKDARVTLNPDRIKYWMSVGAKPSDHCQILFDKFMNKVQEKAKTPAAAKATPENTAPPVAL